MNDLAKGIPLLQTREVLVRELSPLQREHLDFALTVPIVDAVMGVLRGDLLITAAPLRAGAKSEEGTRFEAMEIGRETPANGARLAPNSHMGYSIPEVRLFGAGLTQLHVLQEVNTGPRAWYPHYSNTGDPREPWVDAYYPRPISARSYHNLGKEFDLDPDGTSTWVFPPWETGRFEPRALLGGLYYGKGGKVFNVHPDGKEKQWTPAEPRVRDPLAEIDMRKKDYITDRKDPRRGVRAAFRFDVRERP